ncbi:MAG: DUF427 domain-containing protein [Gammaproteobacteria bacterium]
MKAIWNGQLLAESEDTIVIENNHYFPPSSLNRQFFVDSNMTTKCPWKGTARYYSIIVNGNENKDAAWYYPTPMEAASDIKNYVAFWHGVEVNN